MMMIQEGWSILACYQWSNSQSNSQSVIVSDLLSQKFSRSIPQLGVPNWRRRRLERERWEPYAFCCIVFETVRRTSPSMQPNRTDTGLKTLCSASLKPLAHHKDVGVRTTFGRMGQELLLVSTAIGSPLTFLLQPAHQIRWSINNKSSNRLGLLWLL
jgi:hypothetical protein